MSLHHVFEDIPYHSLLAVDNLLGALDSLYDAALDELANHEGLVKLGRHKFRDTALMHLQFRANDDYRTRRIVDTLTEKVLTETSLLTLERVGKRLERTVDITLHSRRLAAIVEQRVDSLLQQTLLVAQNHLGSLNVDKTLQTVVADDHTAVEVVKVGSGEASAIERHERTEFRGNHRHSLQNHPLRLIAVGRSDETVDNLQALQRLCLALLRAVFVSDTAQFGSEVGEIDILEKFIDSLGTHLGHKLVGIAVLKIAVLLGETVHNFGILFF